MKWLRGAIGGRKAEAPTAQPIDPDLRDLLDEHGLAACQRQLAFAELVGDRDWSLDQDEGLLRLGSDLVLSAQIIGSTSAKGRTWLWAWANPSIDDALCVRAREAARIGRERHLALLTEPEIDIDRIADGHLLALAVGGLLDADAYYRGPHPGGEVFIIVTEPRVREQFGNPVGLAIEVITQALAGAAQLVTSAAVTNYLRGGGHSVIEADGEVRIDGQDSAVFRFDEQGRVVDIQATRGSGVE